MIPVTKPFLPQMEDFNRYVSSIWERQWLTNNGPLVNELELKLQEYLNIKHLLFVANGTLALQLAIKALGVRGEVITTAFSYVATSSSIAWEGCVPIYVDIDPETFNIDPAKIEAAITGKTKAIVATHTFGNPCDIDAIQAIADKHKLKVIYDAAHCFGTMYKNKSVFAYGDISTASFHATKLFHTIEGGAVFSKDPNLLKILAGMRNFGHNGPETFDKRPGINAKNCEFHAAMGLCNLEHMEEILERRRTLSYHYYKRLKNFKVSFPKLNDNLDYNFAYFPVLFETEELLLLCMKRLEGSKIYCRRYFYPPLSALPYVIKTELPVCEDISRRMLCLPLYHTLNTSDLDLICRILWRVQNYQEPVVINKRKIKIDISNRHINPINGHSFP
ncbi:DegT/DnrJ/EryC1/StrS family aminotransferase [Pedobacter gandavensis]|uniref:DegT/DnrJ/EryC1/StrS family aminotransferase n=1 Tax=Pedobacter gandavensis TaxID=2679963 RepID=UPI00292E74C8|nr:DegT/DnrJ/EryC1/StrS family aminotransferase [Pedobacter gandavensis]